MNATTAYRQTIVPDEERDTIRIPRQWFGKTVDVFFIPVADAPPPRPNPVPKFTQAQFETFGKRPHIQRLVGALRNADLPAGATMKQIREMRLAEKYGS